MYQRAMTPDAFQHAIKLLGMTQASAGRFLGVSARTARRYISGEAVISPAQVMLLRSMLHHGEAPLVPRGSPHDY